VVGSGRTATIETVMHCLVEAAIETVTHCLVEVLTMQQVVEQDWFASVLQGRRHVPQLDRTGCSVKWWMVAMSQLAVRRGADQEHGRSWAAAVVVEPRRHRRCGAPAVLVAAARRRCHGRGTHPRRRQRDGRCRHGLTSELHHASVQILDGEAGRIKFNGNIIVTS
jgi:hypothetical protein